MISFVVAMNQNGVIGVNNQLPWHIPEDLQHFKKLTLNKPIVMGRKTFESIGRVLPKRKNIVITRDPSWHFEGVVIYSDLESAIKDNANSAEIMIIGGGEIFKQAMPIADKLYVTEVDYAIKPEATTIYFPAIDLNVWQVAAQHAIVSESGVHCTFKEYLRK